MKANKMNARKIILGMLVALASTTSFAQLRCVAGEYAQYKDQMAEAKGLYNMPINYCIAENRQRQWEPSSQAYADCGTEMAKMKDAMLKARQPKLVEFAEALCEGEHPLGKK